jgi:MFS family permease
MRRLFRSLRHRNYRLYYVGQLVSLTGTWMQHLAQAWLMYRLTGSSLMLGLVGAAGLLPNLLFSLWGGVLADRLPRRTLLIAAQSLALLQALVLGVLTLGGWVTPAQLIALAFLLGVVQAFEMPARQSFVSQLVPREDLPNAVALNSSLLHLARFIGPAIAGPLVAWMGEGPVFLLNGASFVAVLVALAAMRLPVRPGEGREEEVTGSGGGLIAGLHYVRAHPTIRAALGMVAVTSLLGSSAVVLMPVFAAEIFGSGAKSLGWLLSALGVGSLVGALTLAHRGTVKGLERWIAAMAGLAGLAFLLFANMPGLGGALLVLPWASYAMTTLIASSNAYLQLNVPDRLRGRTMALFTIALHGMMPLGQLVLGTVAEFAGAVFTVSASGLLLIAAGTLFGMAFYRARAPGE